MALVHCTSAYVSVDAARGDLQKHVCMAWVHQHVKGIIIPL